MKKKRVKKIIFIVLIAVTLIILMFSVLNLLLREPFLIEDYREEMLKVFPEDLVNSDIKFYEGGILSIVTSKTICNSVYFNKKNINEDIEKKRTIIHETAHLYQAQGVSCFEWIVNGAWLQIITATKHGSRNYAYIYTLNPDNNLYYSKGVYNIEQEAGIIEDYYYLKFLDGNESSILCYGCDDYEDKNTCHSCSHYHSREEIISKLEEKYKEIIKKYGST